MTPISSYFPPFPKTHPPPPPLPPSLPPSLPQILDEQVKELLSAFGPLRGFDLKKDPATGMSKVREGGREGGREEEADL